MAETNATPVPEVDVEDELSRASALTALAQWVERARLLTGEVEAICERDKTVDRDDMDAPTLEERLEASWIGPADAYWTQVESLGLRYLHITVEQHIEAAKKVVLSKQTGGQP